MRWGAIGGALGLGIAALLLGGDPDQARGQAKKNPPGWLNDLGAARTAARQSGKPIMLVFR